jgi:hypothetical protein
MLRYRIVLVVVLVLMAGTTAWVVNGVLTEDEITPNDEFFVVKIGATPEIDGDTWTLTITGLVENETVLTLEQLRAMPAKEEKVTLKCVDGPSDTAVWKGVPLGHVLDMVGVEDGADEVLFRASDGYDSSLTIEDAYADDVLLCYEMNGEVLPKDHGYPLRVVVPGKWGYKWVKWVYRIEVIDYDHKGYWESRGWDDEADILPISEWVPHAFLMTLAALVGGLSAIGGLKFSRDSEFWRDLPPWFSRRFHVNVSWVFFAVLYVTFTYWLVTTVIKRGDVFYSAHGLLGLSAVASLTVGLATGLLLERKREQVRTIHLVSTLMGFLLLIATIGFGLIRT